VGFGEFAFSLEMRDTIARIVREQIDRVRPRYRYAEVVALDYDNGKADVIYVGEENPVRVNMGAVRPDAAGQRVRIEGIGTDKYITDVIGGPSKEFLTNIVWPASLLTGWGLWGDQNNYSRLGFYRQSNGLILVSGLVTFSGGTGATNDICNVTGNYRPREAPEGQFPAHILNGAVNDTARFFDVTNGKLRIRGALPTAGQWVSINGVYPSVNARV
jgi:hypothetical protein